MIHQLVLHEKRRGGSVYSFTESTEEHPTLALLGSDNFFVLPSDQPERLHHRARRNHLSHLSTLSNLTDSSSAHRRPNHWRLSFTLRNCFRQLLDGLLSITKDQIVYLPRIRRSASHHNTP